MGIIDYHIIQYHGNYKEENGLLVEIYAYKQYCKIHQEGPPDQLFIDDSNDGNENVSEEVSEEVEGDV